MKIMFAIVIFAAATSLAANTLSFGAFNIDVPDGWIHVVETGPRDVITLRHPDGVGSLKILSYEAPALVSEDRLRDMTNVDVSVPLAWQHWGDYAGYQYDYIERGALYRQWWLVNGRTLVFVTYSGNPGLPDDDRQAIDAIVRSLTAGRSPAP